MILHLQEGGGEMYSATNLRIRAFCFCPYLLPHAQIIASGLKALQGFALLVAAIVHDYRHRGVNNGYLMKVSHE